MVNRCQPTVSRCEMGTLMQRALRYYANQPAAFSVIVKSLQTVV